MKVGILTYHFALNFGAVLQCYALQKYLLNQGVETYVIDFVSEAQADNTSLYRKANSFRSIAKNILLSPYHAVRKKRNQLFYDFLNEHMVCTERVASLEELKALLKKENFTDVIVGSDQVWNPRIKDFDRAFFLPGIEFVRKLGYAISLGEADVNDLEPYSSDIKKFSDFTVREETAISILNEYWDKPMQITADPTFLLNLQDWKNVLPASKVCNEKYLLCYFINKDKIKDNLRKANEIAKNNNLKLKLIDLRVSFWSQIHHPVIAAGPREFLDMIHNAQFVITDSFHGTVFSLLYQKSFYSINNNPNSIDSRKYELLKKFQLEDRYNVLDKFPNGLTYIDYGRCEKVFKTIQDQSGQILKDMLKENSSGEN